MVHIGKERDYPMLFTFQRWKKVSRMRQVQNMGGASDHLQGMHELDSLDMVKCRESEDVDVRTKNKEKNLITRNDNIHFNKLLCKE